MARLVVIVPLVLVLVLAPGCAETPPVAAVPAHAQPVVKRWWRAEAAVGLAGTITDLQGHPVESAVAIARPTEGTAPEQAVAAKADGTYRLVLEPGRYNVALYAGDAAVSVDAVDVRAGGTTYIDVAIDPRPTGEVIRVLTD